MCVCTTNVHLVWASLCVYKEERGWRRGEERRGGKGWERIDPFLLSLSFVSFLPSPFFSFFFSFFFFFLLDKKKTSLLLQSSSFSLSSFHVSCFHYKNSSSSSGSGRIRHKFSFCCHETRETSPSVCQFNEEREGARREGGKVTH